MSFEIGESVEVIGNEDGMDGSPGRRIIRYDTLIADDGSPLEEVISIRRLRPPPPTVLARYHLGDMVDAWHNESWWVGSGRHWRQEESGSMLRDRVEGIRDMRKFLILMVGVEYWGRKGEQFSGEENWEENKIGKLRKENKIGKEREGNRGRKTRE
ncbi:hypothetical protein LXL04_010434 [Taraxacum kok-saghyz]